ncbi:MAG TPA: hypothetical protein VJ975_02480 [Candidatus Limnocylindria bacterium]|nr:hypothetical protein [Candidatus Limnocylindria bacterium]
MEVADSTGPSAERFGALGLAGVALQLGLAVLFAVLAGSRGTFPAPPEPIPRGAALGILFALPGIVAAIGVASRDRGALTAAALLALAGSVIAFSGVTVVFAVPALLFAVAAGQADTGERRPRRPFALTVAVGIIGAIGMVVAVLGLGILVLPLGVLGVLCLSLARLRRLPSIPSTAAAMLIVAAGIGAGWSLFTMTETRCWEAYETPTGIEYVTVPESSTVGPTDADMIAGGCDSGVFTAQGAGVATILGLGALGVAALRAVAP